MILTFDVMVGKKGDKYYCTMQYQYCPLWPIDSKELEDYIVEEKPSLKNKIFRIAIVSLDEKFIKKIRKPFWK